MLSPLMKSLLDRGLLDGSCLTVTGRTLAENLQDVPISVLAVGPVVLEERGIVGLADINEAFAEMKAGNVARSVVVFES